MKDNFGSRIKDCALDELWTGTFHSPADEARFAQVVSLLSRHFADPIILTGSFAVEWHLRRKNGDARKRRLNDIDIVAASGTAGIGNGLPNDFLINHFHPKRELGNVLIQMVEPHSRTKVDVFSPRSPSVRDRVSSIDIDGIDCEVISSEDLLARLLAIVGIVLEGREIDPKHLDSIERLMDVTDADVAASLWNDYRRINDPVDFHEAFDAIKLALHERPDLFKPEEFSQDVNAECQWCVEADGFPLTARSHIFELLGYV